ncbi:glycosyltransferase family 2 protein [Olsenella massiliensis]|uniref:glycosyltransferase family 2 protein n=1 Tax=Olsenella massiliensis TaxID=1622075 RepID=UPI00071E2787|nr:glycosyltransferase family 2 protein [Olsenella massiliensis]
MRVLAVVPAFNEEQCLFATVDMLVQACPDVDCLIVNDGSRDRTAQVARRCAARVANLPVNTGLTSALKTGMKYAQRHGYDAVVQFDADGQHLPRYIPQLAAALEEGGAHVAIASRYLDGSVRPTGARGAGSRLITLLIRITTGAVITDPTSGMRMYDRQMIRLFAQGFDCAPEPDTIALVAREQGAVVEIQASMRERQGGESYLKLGNVLKYMARTCLSIIMLRFLR